jgi:excinuclease ABC subunit A
MKIWLSPIKANRYTRELSLHGAAKKCANGTIMLVKHALKFDFPIHRQYNQLTEKEQRLLWTGNKFFRGLDEFFKEMEEQTYKIQYRVLLSRYRGKTTCPECKGSRLRMDASYVKINEKSITDVVLMPLDKAFEFFKGLN